MNLVYPLYQYFGLHDQEVLSLFVIWCAINTAALGAVVARRTRR